jgi:hypothetical protein
MQPPARFVLIMLALAGLSGCAQTYQGDFGRRADNVWTNSILPASGKAAARLRGEPVSSYPLTDSEQELRDRAYRFLSPALDRAWLDRSLAELRYTRNMPPDVDSDPTSYYRGLMAEPFRSMTSRYERLRADTDADRTLLGPLLAAAHSVRAADQIRRRAMDATPDLTEPQRADALSRNAENEQLFAWVCASVGARVARYRYALQHLVIAGPQHEAIPAERAVLGLENDPRALCNETVPLIDAVPRNINRGLDRPYLEDRARPGPIPIAVPPEPQTAPPPAIPGLVTKG